MYQQVNKLNDEYPVIKQSTMGLDNSKNYIKIWFADIDKIILVGGGGPSTPTDPTDTNRPTDPTDTNRRQWVSIFAPSY